ncbi:3-oxoacyl-[acyl-carrier-protein] synthase III C-terminal domain-containing protein [Nonomuraea diastatica]|uniref:3-oxoacyl-ACP synthase n=1 Tax=Nonomuraea diastatica TaxID=1848329 RepID=A0A4R4WLU0_9ACTN|nr:3-oxoacyl-[acyl-carrier-protein] synthase III C-terminal domain-containing protein [Nonomuraea diastatica]TDD20268.1 3-oxoacyl-ACP synthase [Nonomuraea diastatica]
MTDLREVAVHLPPRRVAIASLQDELGLTDPQLRAFERFFGLSHIRREPGGTGFDLMLAAAGKLSELRGQEDRVRYVIQARSIPVATAYPRSDVHEVRRALGLGRAEAFTIVHQACASGLLAVDLAGRLLAAEGDPDALALILAGEKTYTTMVRTVPGAAVNGEGAAALLVGTGGGHDRVLGYATRTYGRFNSGLALTDALNADFQQVYPNAVAEVLIAAVDRAGISLDDVALVLPHNVNRVSWVRVCRLIGFPLERVLLDNVPETGHCFCADSFINFRTAQELGRLQPGDRYVMAAVGIGGFFSAMVFEH